MLEVLSAPTGDYREALVPRGPCTLAVGSFDGVHLGHCHMLSAAVSEARRLGVQSVALTFDPHPAELGELGPFRYLTSLGERVERIGRVGVDLVRIVPFVEELARLTPLEWAREVLHDRLQVRTMIVGPTHRFGAKGAGDCDMLVEFGRRIGFEVTVVPHFALAEGAVSSSRIRECLAAGDVRLAARMLGRPYAIDGTVVTGAGRGRTIGFPTANLVPPADRVLPAPGIYACAVLVAGEAYAAGVHFGPVPTFGRDEPVIECHLLDFSGALVGREIRVAFVERLRGIERFESPERLIEALNRDLANARELVTQPVLAACQEESAGRPA